MNCPNCKRPMAVRPYHNIFTASHDLEWVCLTVNCGACFGVAVGDLNDSETGSGMWREGPPPESESWIVLWDDTYIEPAKWSKDSHGELTLERHGTQHRFVWRQHMRWRPLVLPPLPPMKAVGGRAK